MLERQWRCCTGCTAPAETMWELWLQPSCHKGPRLARKKSGGLQVCVECHQVIKAVVLHKYPLPSSIRYLHWAVPLYKDAFWTQFSTQLFYENHIHNPRQLPWNGDLSGLHCSAWAWHCYPWHPPSTGFCHTHPSSCYAEHRQVCFLHTSHWLDRDRAIFLQLETEYRDRSRKCCQFCSMWKKNRQLVKTSLAIHQIASKTSDPET